jgi:hypothetical protein
MSLSWSVLALALLGAEDRQPSKPKPPSPAFQVAVEINGPAPSRTKSGSKAATSAALDPASSAKLKGLCADRGVAEALDEIRTSSGGKRTAAQVAKAIRSFPENAPPLGSSLAGSLPKGAAARPRTLSDPEAGEVWPMKLDEAIRIALDNCEVIRVISFGSQCLPVGCIKPTAPCTGPIVISKLNADGDVSRFKAEALALVRSVEQQYWDLAQAHVQLWAADRAVELAKEIQAREQAELAVGRGTSADVAEASQRLEQFTLDWVTRTSDVITTERQLRNILGLPPADNRRIIPVTPPTEARLEPDWDSSLAQMLTFQPDIVRKKLAMGVPHPGRAESGPAPKTKAESPPAWGDQEKIQQQNELQQVIHQATHSLARMFLEVDAGYQQYQTARRLRKAAAQRLDAQRAYYEEGRITIDRFLDAVSQYATAVATESQYLVTYNISIVALEEAKGTLLAYDHIIVEDSVRRRAACIQATFAKGKEDNQAQTASFEPAESRGVEVPRIEAIPGRPAANRAEAAGCDTEATTTCCNPKARPRPHPQPRPGPGRSRSRSVASGRSRSRGPSPPPTPTGRPHPCLEGRRRDYGDSSQTGCVKAPLQAMSQASTRTHFRPFRSGARRRVRPSKAPVSEASIRWRKTRAPSPEITSTNRSGNVQSSSIRSSGFRPGFRTTEEPLGCPSTVNSGIRTSPVVTKNRPARRASSTGCHPRSKRGTRSGSSRR